MRGSRAAGALRRGPGGAHRALKPPLALGQAENITTLTKAAGIEVEPYWPGLFAKLVEKKSIEDFIVNVGAGEKGRGGARWAAGSCRVFARLRLAAGGEGSQTWPWQQEGRAAKRGRTSSGSVGWAAGGLMRRVATSGCCLQVAVALRPLRAPRPVARLRPRRRRSRRRSRRRRTRCVQRQQPIGRCRPLWRRGRTRHVRLLACAVVQCAAVPACRTWASPCSTERQWLGVAGCQHGCSAGGSATPVLITPRLGCAHAAWLALVLPACKLPRAAC